MMTNGRTDESEESGSEQFPNTRRKANTYKFNIRSNHFHSTAEMKFDPVLNAYVDVETNVILFQEETGESSVDATGPAFVDHDSIMVDDVYGGQGATILEQELNNMRRIDGAFDAEQGHMTPQQTDDWNFARSLQFLEFEIANEEIDGYGEDGTNEGDFHRREVAAGSCRKQLLTISFGLCVIQICILVAMIQTGGYAPSSENPMIGPPVTTMVVYGAKEAALIKYDGEWWRLISTIMLHAGIYHIIPNVLIQMRVGGYLNVIYGNKKFLFIYFASGIFAALQSCIFLPDSVGVGSSGALMGMLTSWLVWIAFRWKKIPPRCHAQRNCQMVIVIGAIVITLATSFSPNVDWAAHFGGAVMGLILGLALLANQLDVTRNQMIIRYTASAAAIGLFIYCFYYVAVVLRPDKSSLSYWEANDDV